MGPLIGLFAVVGMALGQPRLEVVVANGPVVHGTPVRVEVACLQNDVLVEGEAPEVASSDAQAKQMVSRGPGLWTFDVFPEAALSDGEIVVRWRGARSVVRYRTADFPSSKITVPKVVAGPVGEALEFDAVDDLNGTLESKHLRVEAAEGEIDVACKAGSGCTIRFNPSGVPYPRSVPIFIHDERFPLSQPSVVVARLFARPSVPVQTEPGATASLTIGERRYGPITAGSDGLVRFEILVEPGDSEAVVELEDSLGNRQTSSIVIGGVQGPTVGMSSQGSIIEGGLRPRTFVAVLEADGTLNSGRVPVCRGLDRNELFPLGPGLWGGYVSTESVDDQRVSCEVPGQATAALKVEVERARATRLVLQSYPTQLSADIPIAEVQAYLVNGVGDRLPPGLIRIEAELGSVQLDQGGMGEPIVRARYDGTAASKTGGDVLTASWNRPAGEGGVWDVAIRGAAPGVSGRALVDVRAVDQGGRPIDGVAARISMGGKTEEVLTANGGWASVTFPWTEGRVLMVAEVEVAGQIRRTLSPKGSRPVAAAGAPDLVTELSVPIRAGRVHGVVLNPSPRQLTNDGQTGTIRVRLEDQGGNLIVGPAVEVTSSAGTVGPVQVRPDGELTATLVPPVGMVPGPIRLTASTADGRFSASTDVMVVNRTVKWALGARIGAYVGHGGAKARAIGGQAEFKTPVKGLYGRVDLLHYTLAADDTDPVTRSPVEMAMNVIPLGSGLVFRQGGLRAPLWVGGRILLAPYHLSVKQGDTRATNGWGWLPPGAAVHAGAGLRVLRGEAFTEVEYLFLSSPYQASGFNGAVGGVVGTLGFKLLY